VRLGFWLWTPLEVILTLAGQSFHFLFGFVVAQSQAEVGCMADICDKLLIQLVSEQRLIIS